VITNDLFKKRANLNRPCLDGLNGLPAVSLVIAGKAIKFHCKFSKMLVINFVER